MKLKNFTPHAAKALYSRFFSYAASIMPFLIILLLSLFIHLRAISQVVGDICGNPIVVTNLPFYAELNTADFADDYSASHIPNPGPWPLFPNGLDKTWVNGKDIVFQFVADSSMLVEIELTELQNPMGIYVITGCPFTYTMGFNKSYSANQVALTNFQMLSGQTYYIIASTPSPYISASTTFKINIRQQDTQDCPEANANFGELCDDGIQTTINDTYSINCTCEGEPTVQGAVCENPIEIDSLPFIQQGSLEPYGNYYSADDIAPTVPGYIHSPYLNDDDLNGNEVVFSYTPAVDQLVDIDMGRISHLSLYVFTGCPFSSTHVIFNPQTPYKYGKFTAVPLSANSTYFFVVSTNSNYPLGNQFAAQDFHIEIRETGVFDCNDAQLNVNNRCDDGDILTFPDIMDMDCNCVGTPTGPGDICANPLIINELPFHTVDSTIVYGNNYLDYDHPYSLITVLNHSEVVYSYTPSRNEIINIHLDNSQNAGLFVFTGCPFEGVESYETGTTYDELQINDLDLLEGITYYIVVAGNDANPNKYEFTLDISLEWAYCQNLGAYAGEPCDDGDITTTRDTVSYHCECVGEPTIPGEICGNPLVIPTLPFFTSDSTYHYGNDYSDSDLPTNTPQVVGNNINNAIYLDGNDVVYSYTPFRDEIVRISPIDLDGSMGVYVVTNCPFDSTVAITESGCCNSNYELVIDSLHLTAETTYYIIISTFSSYYSNKKYNLKIELLWAYCEEFDLPVFSPCDDGIVTTIDAIDEYCECIGTATIPGQICGNPLPIESLPFTTTDTIYGYGDNYSSADFPPLAPGAITNEDNNPEFHLFLYKPEVVYSYTPTENELLTVTMNTVTNYDGLFVFSGCPFETTEGYFVGSGDNTNLVISPLPVLQGITYYIVVSPDFTINKSFTLNIEVEILDCPDLNVDFGVSCDDGDPDTENDIVTESCICAGTPIDYDCVNTEKYPIYNAIPDPFGEETAIAYCNHYDEYSQITGVYTGHSYAFAGLNIDSGALPFITVRRDSVNGPVLGTGTSPLIVTAISDADLFVHWNKNADCGTSEPDFYCVNTSMVCITCPLIIDCEGVSNGDSVAGTHCDDNNPGTVRDVWNGACECVGETPVSLAICETAVLLDCNAPPTTFQSLNGIESFTTDCETGINGYWFTFTGNGGNIDVSFSKSFGGGSVALYSGDCYGLESIECFSFWDDVTYEILNTVAHQDYYVYISYWNSLTTGEITISIECDNIFNGSVNGIPNCVNRPATLRFYEPGTTTLISERATSIDQNGNFDIQDPPIGLFDVILKPYASLALGIPNYEVVQGQNTLDFGSLKRGDINGDNAINVIDISYVNLSFGKSVGHIFFDVRADSNCDGIVNILDLSILNMSYLKTGAVAPLPEN